MTYFCNDCSYRGKKASRQGACPACGSLNIARIKAQETPEEQERQHKAGKIRLTILVLLWLYLLAMIIWKLVH